MKIKSVGKIALFALLLGSAVTYAFPQYDEEFHYYSDSTYTDMVGGKYTTCVDGTRYWGEQTQYRKLIIRRPCRDNGGYPKGI